MPPFSVWRDTLAAVLLVSAAPVITVAALAWDAARVRRLAPPLVSVAAGALAGAALFQLVPEGYAAAAAGGWGRSTVPALVLAGFATFAALAWALHGADPHGADPHGADPHGADPHGADPHGADPHGAPGDRRPARPRQLAALALLGDALHNLVDGALIAATFVADPTSGVLATVAVALHEVPRELGSFGVLVHGGVSPRRALALVGGTALLAGAGATATLALGPAAARAAHAVLPFAAGNFLYVAGALLLPALRPGAPAGARRRRAALAALGGAVTAAPALLH